MNEYGVLVDDNDRRKMKYLKENLFQCQFVHDKPHLDCPGFEYGSLQWQTGN